MTSYRQNDICVIGAGKWGKNHIKTLDSLGALSGVVDNDEVKLGDVISKYPLCKTFKTIDHALEQDFDGYIVATGPSSHYYIAKKIIEKKKHILIEKPMTLNSKDAVKLCDLANKNEVKLMVGHLLLFHPAFKKIKEMLNDGHIGTLQYMYSNRLNFGTIRSNENVFWSFAPHDISLFQFYANSNPNSIFSIGADILQPGIHDSTVTTLKYENGIMGHIFVSWLHPFKEHRFILIGSEGMLFFEDSKKDKPLLHYSKSISFEGDVPIAEEKSAKNIDYKFEYPLTNELKYFLNGINGEDIKIANGQSGIEVINILEQASRFLKSNEK